MKSAFDLVDWSRRVIEKKRKEDAFAEKLAAYCATFRMIDETLGDALAAGDDALVAAIKDERARYQRDHLPALLDRAKELSR